MIISRTPLDDALDHAVRGWDFDQTPAGSWGQPLAQFMSQEDVELVLEQHLAWRNVKRVESNEPE